MHSAEELRSEIESARDLGSIAKAMKALSAVRIRQSRQAVESLRDYVDTVDRGFQILLRASSRVPGSEAPRRRGRAVAVVVGSDLGMVGTFNTSIVSFATEALEKRAREWEIIAIGERVASQLSYEGRRVVTTLTMPDTADAMASRVRELLLALEDARARVSPDRVLVFYNAYRSGSRYEPKIVQLLPLDREWLNDLAARDWDTGVLPGFQVDVDELMSALVREHLFVSLMRAIAESHASENASRLAAMESAERRIEERIEELTGRMNQSRQQKMTEELLDLMVGVMALEEEHG